MPPANRPKFVPQQSCVLSPVASHTLSLVPPADAALGRRPGNEMMQSIWNFEFENGRRYHGYKAGSYPLPNDEVRATTHLFQMTHCTGFFGCQVEAKYSCLTSGSLMLNNMGKYHRRSSNGLTLNTMSWCCSAAITCILHLSQFREGSWILERARVSGQCRWQNSTQNPWWLGPISLLSNQESTSLWPRWA